MHTYVACLIGGILGAFVTALAFIIVLHLILPPDDLAYSQTFLMALSDPMVQAIATPVALVSGILASPLLYFSLRGLRLTLTIPIVLGSVLASIVLVTPFSPLLGLISAYVALIGSCFFCWRILATHRVDTEQAQSHS